MAHTVMEISEPEHPRYFHGTLLAEIESPVQSWKVLATEEFGEMLFIDGQHQSSLKDEHLYHEMLVHSVMHSAAEGARVLVLGGSEGSLIREILKWPQVAQVQQVDWDASLCSYFQSAERAHWNQGAYQNPKVALHIGEAQAFLESLEEETTYDTIFVDLLDPTEENLNFCKKILSLAKAHLKGAGSLIVNAGYVSRGQRTPAADLATFMKEQFQEPQFHRVALQQFIPSFFGEWCFLAAVPRTWCSGIHEMNLPSGLCWFTKAVLLDATRWSEDYPAEIRNFWIPTPEERSLSTVSAVVTGAGAGAGSDAAEPIEKLREVEDPWECKVFEHYGC